MLLEHLFAFMALHTSYFHHGYHSLKANEADVNLLREVRSFFRGYFEGKQ